MIQLVSEAIVARPAILWPWLVGPPWSAYLGALWMTRHGRLVMVGVPELLTVTDGCNNNSTQITGPPTPAPFTRCLQSPTWPLPTFPSLLPLCYLPDVELPSLSFHLEGPLFMPPTKLCCVCVCGGGGNNNEINYIWRFFFIMIIKEVMTVSFQYRVSLFILKLYNVYNSLKLYKENTFILILGLPC